MNRFHLLTVEEVEEKPAAKTAVNAKTEAGSGKNDRKSRGAPRKDGEKHSTVGKGSWGRTTDEAAEVSAEDETVGQEVVGEETVAPVKPNYKTVNEYLAEQAEAQRRLAAMKESLKTRAAPQLDSDFEVVKKEEKADGVKGEERKNTPAGKENKRLTLQDLNKIIPAAPATSSSDRRAPRSGEGQKRTPGAGRRFNKDEQSTGDRRGNNNGRRDNNKSGRQFNTRGGKSGSGANSGALKIDLSDTKAFPSLA